MKLMTRVQPETLESKEVVTFVMLQEPLDKIVLDVTTTR